MARWPEGAGRGLRILIYTRVSPGGSGVVSTDGQEQTCRAFAEARGWTVVGVHTDIDLSAYRPGSVRPAFEALLDDAQRGATDGILVWKFDRLVRRNTEFERLWDITEDTGVFLASVLEPIDTSTPLGLALVRMVVALASLESATMGTRISGAVRRNAELGRYPRRKSYGLAADGSAVDAAEAAVIREAAERVLAGETVARVARSFHERGFKSTRGSRFTARFLVDVLRAPRLVGDVVHQGAVVMRDCYPPVLDRDAWERLQLCLARRDVGDDAPRAYDHVRSLRRLVTCGLCGKALVVRRHGVLTYRCEARQGCSGLSIKAESLDAWAIDRVLERSRRLGLERLDRELPHLGHLELAAALRELVADHRRGRISMPEYTGTRSLLLGLIHRGDVVGDDDWVRLAVRNPDRRTAAAMLSTEQQRLLIADRVEAIVVNRALSGSLFDPGRCDIRWRNGLDLEEPPVLRPNSVSSVSEVLRQVAARNLSPLTRAAYDADRPPNALQGDTLIRRMGSWEKVLTSAGLPPPRYRRGWTHDAAAGAVARWHATAPRQRRTDYEAAATIDRTLPTLRVLARLFGRWDDITEAAMNTTQVSETATASGASIPGSDGEHGPPEPASRETDSHRYALAAYG